MKKNFSLVLLISQDVIFKPFFVYKLIERLKKENLYVSELIEVKRKKKISKNKKNNNIIWSKFALIQLSFLFFTKKLISILPIPLFLKWKSTVKLVAKKKRIPYRFIDNLNDYLKKSNFKKGDILFSFQHQIIKNPDDYNFELINCHPGDLSLYRGIKPIFWAMIDQQEFATISVHHIDKGIDTGELILGEKFKLTMSLADNYLEAYNFAPKVVAKAIIKLVNNNSINRKSVYKNLGSYKNTPDKVKISNFYNAGFTTKLSFMNFLRLLKCF